MLNCLFHWTAVCYSSKYNTQHSHHFNQSGIYGAAVVVVSIVRDAQIMGAYLIQTSINVHRPFLKFWISSADLANDSYLLTQLLTSSQCLCILSV